MKIALVGYGKMGKAIEETALHRNHEIIARITIDNLEDFTDSVLEQADVAIEFTGPHSAFENVKRCLDAGLPVICGSTGWTGKLEEINALAKERGVGFLYASNFSVGVNIFFEVNKKLAAMMDHQPGYEITVEEIHHTEKKDAPSGTAITLAEQVLEEIERKTNWVNHIGGKPGELSIISKRIDPAAGTHLIKYSSAIDDIEIIHTAHNRKGFAYGAVLAAEFIKERTGIYSMKDVLNL